MSARALARIIPSVPTSDGGGVRLRRSIGHTPAARLDPFLMLDDHMQHRDHLGNTGELVSGGVQWMTAGRGIVHSEMPQQERGRMRGFQLWINLPAREKMKPAGYRDIQPSEIPAVALATGGRVKVIAGTLE